MQLLLVFQLASWSEPGGNKLTHSVTYDEELSLPNTSSSSSSRPSSSRPGPRKNYRLSAVGVRVGDTPDSGHCYAIIRPGGVDYLKANDGRVTPISSAKALAATAGCYLLFYELQGQPAATLAQQLEVVRLGLAAAASQCGTGSTAPGSTLVQRVLPAAASPDIPSGITELGCCCGQRAPVIARFMWPAQASPAAADAATAEAATAAAEPTPASLSGARPSRRESSPRQQYLDLVQDAFNDPATQQALSDLAAAIDQLTAQLAERSFLPKPFVPQGTAAFRVMACGDADAFDDVCAVLEEMGSSPAMGQYAAMSAAEAKSELLEGVLAPARREWAVVFVCGACRASP